MRPTLEFEHLRLGEILGLGQIQSNDTRSNVDTTNVRRQNRLVALQHPGRQPVGGANEPGFIRVRLKKLRVRIDPLCSQKQVGTRDRHFANTPFTESAPTTMDSVSRQLFNFKK